MTAGESEERTFLLALYQHTQDDTQKQVSMYDVGETVGLDRTKAGRMAENLIGRGWAEVKTLSGGIGITVEGIKTARAAEGETPSGPDLRLGNGPVLDESASKAVASVLDQIKARVPDLKGGYQRIEEVVMDIKTMEIQMLSPRPKTAIIREALRSMQSSLASAGMDVLAEQVKKIIA